MGNTTKRAQSRGTRRINNNALPQLQNSADWTFAFATPAVEPPIKPELPRLKPDHIFGDFLEPDFLPLELLQQIVLFCDPNVISTIIPKYARRFLIWCLRTEFFGYLKRGMKENLPEKKTFKPNLETVLFHRYALLASYY
jgi:hypothetical protein